MHTRETMVARLVSPREREAFQANHESTPSQRKAVSCSQIRTAFGFKTEKNCVGTAAPGCPVEQRSTGRPHRAPPVPLESQSADTGPQGCDPSPAVVI